MIKTHSWRIIVLLLVLEVLEAVTIVDHYTDDDYVLEHRVTYDEALVEARNLVLSSGDIPGCKECTHEEMTYCKNGNVISDHCCCDGGYNRVFSFVEHVCLVGRQACRVIASDCAEYERLRECCCHSYLGSIWKYRAGGVDSLKPKILLTALLPLLVFLFSII